MSQERLGVPFRQSGASAGHVYHTAISVPLLSGPRHGGLRRGRGQLSAAIWYVVLPPNVVSHNRSGGLDDHVAEYSAEPERSLLELRLAIGIWLLLRGPHKCFH
jgi:hypothetical protein